MSCGYFKLSLVLAGSSYALCVPAETTNNAKPDAYAISDHYDGERFLNLESSTLSHQQHHKFSFSGWLSGWVFGHDWPEWPEYIDEPPGPVPAKKIEDGKLRITSVGHSTFLIQMDGINFLTDPIWSERATPVSGFGPKRHRAPGIRFSDLPPIDVVLVSHSHYDHLDMPTLEQLAEKFHPRAFSGLGNRELIAETDMKSVDEMDWWQTLPVAKNLAITFVPAQHFSGRSLWDRDETLWGGFVISGPSGHVFYAGDTGYGSHFEEIGKRFPGIRLAVLPIAPVRPDILNSTPRKGSGNHMGAEEAFLAHKDLKAWRSVACHFNTFQLIGDEYDYGPKHLVKVLAANGVDVGMFMALFFGQPLDVPRLPDTPVENPVH